MISTAHFSSLVTAGLSGITQVKRASNNSNSQIKPTIDTVHLSFLGKKATEEKSATNGIKITELITEALQKGTTDNRLREISKKLSEIDGQGNTPDITYEGLIDFIKEQKLKNATFIRPKWLKDLGGGQSSTTATPPQFTPSDNHPSAAVFDRDWYTRNPGDGKIYGPNHQKKPTSVAMKRERK